MKILKAIFRILLIISVLVIGIFAIVEMPKRPCESICIITHSQNQSVIFSQHDVETVIHKNGIKVVGEKMKDINLEKITQLLQQNPYIQKLNFIRFSGTQLRIDYTLRPIVLHVFNTDGQQYFVDKSGKLLPYTPKMQDNLLIANGHINQSYKQRGLADKNLMPALHLTNLINEDAFYQAQFRQIYINEYQQMELVSTIGKQIILFGTEENAAEKLANLKEVYQNGLSHKGYDQYALLDARYKHRIIAQRK